jgi:hypothetical protein
VPLLQHEEIRGELDGSTRVSRSERKVHDRRVARIAGAHREEHRARELLVGPRQTERLSTEQVRPGTDLDTDDPSPGGRRHGEDRQQTERPKGQSLHGASGYRGRGVGRL